MGALFGPETSLKVGGGIGFALSVAAIVLLIRLNPRRVLRRAAAAGNPEGEANIVAEGRSRTMQY